VVRRAIRLFVLIEGLSFVTAALTHFGVLMGGYRHHPAGVAEAVIGTVLLIGLALTYFFPAAVRVIGLAIQGFALLGTLVGMYTIIIGVGPRTMPDLVYHAVIVIVLVFGLFTTARARNSLTEEPEAGAPPR
jgi:hypothetical protein